MALLVLATRLALPEPWLGKEGALSLDPRAIQEHDTVGILGLPSPHFSFSFPLPLSIFLGI